MNLDYNNFIGLQRTETRYLIINEYWLVVWLFLISKIVLIIKLWVLWLVLLKLVGYIYNLLKIDKIFDSSIIESFVQGDYKAYKSRYKLSYRFSKSKLFDYIYNQFSNQCYEILEKYREPGSKVTSRVNKERLDKLRAKQSKLFGCRGGHKDISQILTIVVESHYTKSVRIRSVKTRLKILINDQVVGKFCAQLGILSFGPIGNLVPKIIGIIINANVIFKPIEDGKVLVQFYSTVSFIERIEKVQIKRPPEISPKQILFVPGPRNTNQVTIVTLGSKFKLMCSLRENVDFEKTSQASFVPLAQRTKTFQDIIQADDMEVYESSEIIVEDLARRVKAERIHLFDDLN